MPACFMAFSSSNQPRVSSFKFLNNYIFILFCALSLQGFYSFFHRIFFFLVCCLLFSNLSCMPFRDVSCWHFLIFFSNSECGFLADTEAPEWIPFRANSDLDLAQHYYLALTLRKVAIVGLPEPEDRNGWGKLANVFALNSTALNFYSKEEFTK